MNREERAAFRSHIVDACVRVARDRGYSDASGMLRGTLFLAGEPMSLDDLVEETGYSKSTVSSNMNLLEGLGMAKRVVTPGDKRYSYVCVSDPDSIRATMMSNIKKEIRIILEALDMTERDMKADGPDTETTLARMESIRRFYSQTEKLLEIMSGYTTDEIIEILSTARK